MERYDIAIIGTGPAGLEAAITAKLRNKSILLLGSEELSAKIDSAHEVKNYLGLPDVSGSSMREAFTGHLKAMDISITADRAAAIYAMGDFFAIQGHAENYEASTVILATGVSAEKPFPGEKENLGRGVSYCATCDASLYRGKSAIVIGYSAKEEAEAAFLAEVADKVYYLPMYEGCDTAPAGTELILGVKPSSIEKAENGLMSLKYENGEPAEANGIFILRENIAPTDLVPGLEIKDGHVVTDRKMTTNLAGLFACGDITGTPYQYAKAAGEGNVAALSAVSFLSGK